MSQSAARPYHTWEDLAGSKAARAHWVHPFHWAAALWEVMEPQLPGDQGAEWDTACVLHAQKFGCTLSCQASGAANRAGCHSTVMPKKLSCKVHNAQVFPRASHSVTRWHINISRFSHSLFHGVHNVFAFQLPLCHNHMWHVMFYFKICTSCLCLRILNRIFAQLQNICLLLLIDLNCFTFYRALFKIIGSKAENKLFQSGMDDNNVLIDQPITEVRPQGDLMVSVLLCENVTLKGWCSVPLPAQMAICTHLFWRLVLRL